MRHGGFVDGSISMTGGASEQLGLWQDRVLLNEEFYRALRDHPVPVSEAGLRAIGPRSMVIDVYIWLAYRLHALTRDVEVSWAALHVPKLVVPKGGAQATGGRRRFRSRASAAPSQAMTALAMAMSAMLIRN